MTVTPVNYRKQDASAEAIARDVDYALQIADFYTAELPGGAPAWLHRRVLELGPGYSLGTAVVLACHGATVTVADRYLSPYDADYHGPFLRALLARLGDERPQLSPEPILALLEAGEWIQPGLSCLHLGIEDLTEVPDDSFDVVVSNAVFEHVEHVPQAWDVLARITKPGGHGIHQVDFRDHRDFSRPLEYMTLSADDFATLFAGVHGECGNRWRPDGMQREIERAGFATLHFLENMSADADYLDDLLPRLDASCAHLDRDLLRPISGCFVLRCEQGAEDAEALEPDNPADLARTRCRYAFAAPAVAGKAVLDLGCGTGAGARQLLAAGATHVIGVDRRAAALDIARRSDPRGDEGAWLQQDLADGRLPFPDGSFDVVLAMNLLGHLPESVQEALVAEVQRVLASDGVAFFSVPNLVPEGAVSEQLHAPAAEAFIERLSPFGWVRFFGQVDVVSSLVLPLDGDEGAVTTGSLTVQAGADMGDGATGALIARCQHTRPSVEHDPEPVAHAFGVAGAADGAGDRGAAASDGSSLLYEQFVRANAEAWKTQGG